ncbi:hypothetical protein MEQU1_001234 [Malassezia equina]|uniref:Uncharacterized protein n=1 Tax=Malassezia equina TaxID=1381935 RepID=A0AAF0EHQ8_9BASI|nr:hypothetical protein MEQU1_001234 [Malassezia equina]
MIDSRIASHVPKTLSSVSHASRGSKKSQKRSCKAQDEASRLALDALIDQIRPSPAALKKRAPTPQRVARRSNVSQALKEFENLST